MIICLCGNEKLKVLNELKQVYKDKLIVFNYYYAAFRTIVETESVRYKLENDCKSFKDARNLYLEYVNEIVTNKTNEFIKNNKEKIIVLVSDNVLSKDLDKTEFFDKADLKVLTNSHNPRYEYDKSKFDLVIDKNENINIKKLVKL